MTRFLYPNMQLKRYLENVLDGFEGKEQEVVDCSIHFGWVVPAYKNVEADIKQIRERLPALTAEFNLEAERNEAEVQAEHEYAMAACAASAK